MNLVDSSGWIAHFLATEEAEFFRHAIKDVRHLIVPSIVIYEVCKKVALERDIVDASKAFSTMEQGIVVPLDAHIALLASRVSIEYSLPMADSIIFATAEKNDALLWTMDKHFEGMERVEYFPKKKS